MTVVYTSATRAELKEYLRQLPGILSGRLADLDGIAHGFKLRLAFAFFSVVKEAFIVKARGGTDECGITWPKLSRKYLAYQRPMGQGGKGSLKPPKAGGIAPGARKKNGQLPDGFMTEGQYNRWRKVYGTTLARLLLQVPEAEARKRAAQIAWADAKRSGVRTKLDVFGNREVEILRDRGILFNSLSPGVLTEDGPDASYGKPDQQHVEERPGEIAVGTNVKYAAYHQNGKRPYWPKDGNLPGAWWEEILDAGRSGILQIQGPQN